MSPKVNNAAAASDNLIRIGGGNVTYVKLSELKPGVSFEGIYTEKTAPDTYGKLGYRIAGDTETYHLNGTGQLDKLMSQISVGAHVRIVYNGTIVMKKGKFKGKEAHQFELFAAPSALQKVSAPAAAAASSDDNDESEESGADW